MVLGKLLVPGRPTALDNSGGGGGGGGGASALAVGAGEGLFGHFYSHLSFLFSFCGVVGWCEGAG